eukprot:CAMPEP_0177328148 /NCGR_PEP_ID=MMETSP0368-20130122/19269_1 /TAXON_ID=447022 ORGANISM="Scrippsiella hangoei-like, Strain SHHI-4" /NCGR_SAMPLE_ID=MMETSP0368 /ASSEMBLY_ACC=CAM_ASM_000363 /LENGTH=37 /DNA_ID= /DNA_START= /DNA_END= /DNA_ORIENTATION=
MVGTATNTPTSSLLRPSLEIAWAAMVSDLLSAASATA